MKLPLKVRLKECNLLTSTDLDTALPKSVKACHKGQENHNFHLLNGFVLQFKHVHNVDVSYKISGYYVLEGIRTDKLKERLRKNHSITLLTVV